MKLIKNENSKLILATYLIGDARQLGFNRKGFTSVLRQIVCDVFRNPFFLSHSSSLQKI